LKGRSYHYFPRNGRQEPSDGRRFSVQNFFIEVAEGRTKAEPAVVIANQAKISGLHAASA
jgi:hypothetical protein